MALEENKSPNNLLEARAIDPNHSLPTSGFFLEKGAMLTREAYEQYATTLITLRSFENTFNAQAIALRNNNGYLDTAPHSENDQKIRAINPAFNLITDHLESLSKDANRNSVTFFGEEIKTASTDELRVKLKKAGFSKNDLSLLSHYTQMINNLILNLLNIGNQHNNQYFFKASDHFSNIYRSHTHDLLHYVVLQLEYASPNGERFVDLPPATAYFKYTAKGVQFIAVELPSLYAPLITASTPINFETYYQQITGRVVETKYLDASSEKRIAPLDQWTRLSSHWSLVEEKIERSLDEQMERHYAAHALTRNDAFTAKKESNNDTQLIILEINEAFPSTFTPNTVYLRRIFNQKEFTKYKALYVDPDGFRFKPVSLADLGIKQSGYVYSYNTGHEKRKRKEIVYKAKQPYRRRQSIKKYISDTEEIFYKEKNEKIRHTLCELQGEIEGLSPKYNQTMTSTAIVQQIISFLEKTRLATKLSDLYRSKETIVSLKNIETQCLETISKKPLSPLIAASLKEKVNQLALIREEIIAFNPRQKVMADACARAWSLDLEGEINDSECYFYWVKSNNGRNFVTDKDYYLWDDNKNMLFYYNVKENKRESVEIKVKDCLSFDIFLKNIQEHTNGSQLHKKNKTLLSQAQLFQISQITGHIRATKQKRQVLQSVPKISELCVQNPRLLLLFTQHSHLTCLDKVLQRTNVLKECYDFLDFSEFYKYDQSKFSLTTKKRLEKASYLYQKVNDCLSNPDYKFDIKLKEFINPSLLNQLREELGEEVSYLKEVNDLRENYAHLNIPLFLSPKKAENDCVDAPKFQNISEFARKLNSKKNTVEPKTIESRYKLWIENCNILKDVEKMIRDELSKKYNLEVNDFNSYLKNDDKQSASAFYNAVIKKQPDLKHSKAVFFYLWMLNVIIKPFKDFHGENGDKQLEYIEDYEAVIIALRETLKLSQQSRFFWQKKPLDKKIGDLLRKASEKNSSGQPVFCLHLSRLYTQSEANYRACYSTSFYQRILAFFFKRFRFNKMTTFKETASPKALLLSHQLAHMFLNELNSAEDSPRFKQIKNRINTVFNWDNEENTEDQQHDADDQWLQALYKTHEKETDIKDHRSALKALFDFMFEIHSIRINSFSAFKEINEITDLDMAYHRSIQAADNKKIDFLKTYRVLLETNSFLKESIDTRTQQIHDALNLKYQEQKSLLETREKEYIKNLRVFIEESFSKDSMDIQEVTNLINKLFLSTDNGNDQKANKGYSFAEKKRIKLINEAIQPLLHHYIDAIENQAIDKSADLIDKNFLSKERKVKELTQIFTNARNNILSLTQNTTNSVQWERLEKLTVFLREKEYAEVPLQADLKNLEEAYSDFNMTKESIDQLPIILKQLLSHVISINERHALSLEGNGKSYPIIHSFLDRPLQNLLNRFYQYCSEKLNEREGLEKVHSEFSDFPKQLKTQTLKENMQQIRLGMIERSMDKSFSGLEIIMPNEFTQRVFLLFQNRKYALVEEKQNANLLEHWGAKRSEKQFISPDLEDSSGELLLNIQQLYYLKTNYSYIFDVLTPEESSEISLNFLQPLLQREFSYYLDTQKLFSNLLKICDQLTCYIHSPSVSTKEKLLDLMIHSSFEGTTLNTHLLKTQVFELLDFLSFSSTKEKRANFINQLKNAFLGLNLTSDTTEELGSSVIKEIREDLFKSIDKHLSTNKCLFKHQLVDLEILNLCEQAFNILDQEGHGLSLKIFKEKALEWIFPGLDLSLDQASSGVYTRTRTPSQSSRGNTSDDNADENESEDESDHSSNGSNSNSVTLFSNKNSMTNSDSDSDSDSDSKTNRNTP